MQEKKYSFEDEVAERLRYQSRDPASKEVGKAFLETTIANKYSYNYSWLGRPIIQYPQDILALQEVVWRVQPEIILETGIAHGGSLILSASLLELNRLCGGPENGKVIGVDIDIRSHNREAIEAHPLSARIDLIEGSSVDEAVVAEVKVAIGDAKQILIVLDSNHTHDHVLEELEIYSALVPKGSYLIVFDTVIEDLSEELIGERPWSKGNSPKSAVREFLATSDRFEVDEELESKLLVTVAPEGYLKCILD